MVRQGGLFKKAFRFFKANSAVIYRVFLIIFVFTVILIEKTNISGKVALALKLCKYASLIPMVFKIALIDFKTYKSRDKVILVSLAVCFLVSMITGNGKLLLQLFIIIVAAKGTSFKNNLKVFFICETALVLLIMVLSLVGIIPNDYYIRPDIRVVRFCLGFAFATYPAIFVYSLTCVYIYLRSDRIKIYEYLILFVINLFLFFATNTRFEIVCAAAVMVLSIIHKYIKNKTFNEFVKYIAILSMPFLTVISIFLAYTYKTGDSFFYTADKLLSGRIHLMNQAVEKYGVTAFSQDIEWVDLDDIRREGLTGKAHNNVVDNGYINVMLNQGIAVLVLIETAFVFVIIIEEKRNNTICKYIILMLALHSFINPQLLQIVYNPFILLLPEVIFMRKQHIDGKIRRNGNVKNIQ